MLIRYSFLVLPMLCCLALPCPATEHQGIDTSAILAGLKGFYANTAREDGSFQSGVDLDYLGISDSAYSDLAAVTYACTIHKTFGWKLPYEEKTIAFLLSRQKATGEFVNVAGTVDPTSPQGKVYNTTQALVALHALGVQPRHDPLPVFEEILKQDYKTLPAYSTSFFPLAYLCAGKPIPQQADQSIRALMIQDDEGYLNDHIAATFHASHYYSLVGEPTPKSALIVTRVLRDQNKNGSWLLNLPSRDRHATFDAVFTLQHEGAGRDDCRQAIANAAQWALSCRNSDGGFGHFPGSTSDADAVYFQVGTLLMAGVLKPADPLPNDPHLLSWGHLMPLRAKKESDPGRVAVPGWVSSLAFQPGSYQLAAGCGDNSVRLWDCQSKLSTGVLQTHQDIVSAVAFAPDRNRLASASYDKTAIIWDLDRHTAIHTLVGHRGPVLCLAYLSADSLATGSIDGTIRYWNVKTGQCEQTLAGHKSWVNSIALDSFERRLISGSSDGTVKVWSTHDGKLLKDIPVTNAEVRSVALSPDGKYLAAGVRYGSVKLWMTKDWKQLYTLQCAADDVWSIAFSSDSKQLLAAAGEWNRPTEIAVWDVATGKPTGTLKHPGEVLSLAVSHDGEFIAAGGADKTISIFREAAR